MSTLAPSLPSLSKVIAGHLSTVFGGQGVAALHNSQVVYSLPELKDLHVDCWPAGVQRPKVTRSGRSKVIAVNVAIQRRAETQAEYDILTNLADDIVDSLIETEDEDGAKVDRRFAADGVSVRCSEAEFSEIDVFDRFEQYDKSVFISIVRATFERIV